MKRTFLLLFVACWLLPTTLPAQTPGSWPKTMLWRISGNGLQKTSFLFGSMHLQDKRIFQLSDSVYYYLDQAEGYAMEIDMRELIDSLARKALAEKKDKDEAIDGKRLKNPAEKKKILDSLLQNVRERKDKASKKQIEAFRNERMRKAIKNKEMPTILDAFLYGIAQRKGKWLGGIEDVQDQLILINEFGEDMTSDELMAPDAMIEGSLENMLRIYLDADLDEVQKLSSRSSSPDEDLTMLKRNSKMTRRMDSLVQLRNMFFTVGAAHLPGDSGVISQLRKMGYQVDPVFGAKRIDPDKYLSGLSDLAWVKVEDDRHSYEIEMPGPPSQMELAGNAITMEYCVDITTMAYYMTTSMPATAAIDISQLIKKVTENGTIANQKNIEKEGARGAEVVFESEDGTWYRLQYLLKEGILYMLLTGGEKKEMVSTKDAERFFRSFTAKKVQLQSPEEKWSVFTMEDKAMTVLMPGSPIRNTDFESKMSKGNWKYTVYHHANKDVYYMLQVRDVTPGYYLSGDSVGFSDCKSYFSNFIYRDITEQRTSIQSFPALRFEGKDSAGTLLFKTLTINRGNRVYVLLAGGPDQPASVADIDRYLASVELRPYKKSDWKKEWSPNGDFYTQAPSVVEVLKTDEEEEPVEDDGARSYVAYDSNRTVSYQVYKTVLSPYYWTTGDSLFFEQMGAQYKGVGDSVVYKRAVTNGALKGVEWMMIMPDNNNRRRFRQVLNGDTLYTIISFIPSQYIDEKEHNQFFEAFRVTRENTLPTIFTSKARQLLTDLQSADTAVFSKASEAIGSASFGPDDRELLHQALLKIYIDDTLGAYYPTRQQIATALKELADSSTIEFVRKHVPLQTGSREMLKLDLLNVLARYKTAYSYAVLKQLLLEYTPAEKRNTELSYFITDSMELTRQLFPEILALSNDDLFAERIISISVELLDSNLIDASMLMPYRRNFLYTADTALRSLRSKMADEDYYDGYDHVSMVQLLQYFNDAESNKLLQQYLLLDDLVIKQEAAMALLKNSQPVPAKELEKVAADKGHRRDLYQQLIRIGKRQLFPSRYLTQQYMAEADVYTTAYDEEEPQVSYIGKREIIYKGEKRRFFLFKVSFDPGEEGNAAEYTYLGIGGSYVLDAKNIEGGENATGVYWKENFDAEKIDQQLEAFLAWLKEPAAED